MKFVGTTERTELVTKPRWVTTTEEETFDVYLIELSKNDLYRLGGLVERLDLRDPVNKSHHYFFCDLQKCLKS